MSQRLNYIDAFRGLGILLVIYSHLSGFSWHLEHATSIASFFSTFFLGIMFFVSGFVGYKVDLTGQYGSFMLKKTRTLLIPTVFSFIAFAWYMGFSPLNSFLHNPNKGGFWYSYVLFEMFIAYALFKWVLHKVKNEWHYLSLFAVMMAGVLLLFKYTKDSGWAVVFSTAYWVYGFMFLCFGMLCRRYESLFFRIISYRWGLLALFVLAFINNFMPMKWQVVVMARIVLIFALFYHHRAFFDGNRWYHRILSMIGRYSLVIYFMHFMLLFKMPPAWVDYLNSLHSDFCFYGPSAASFVEFCISAPVALLMALTCVLFKRIINFLPVVPELFFGNRD